MSFGARAKDQIMCEDPPSSRSCIYFYSVVIDRQSSHSTERTGNGMWQPGRSASIVPSGPSFSLLSDNFDVRYASECQEDLIHSRVRALAGPGVSAAFPNRASFPDRNNRLVSSESSRKKSQQYTPTGSFDLSADQGAAACLEKISLSA